MDRYMLRPNQHRWKNIVAEKNGFYFQDYALDVSALKELGGKYLLSAAWIENGEETGLRLVREEPFETQDSYYRIFLYEIL